MHTLPERDTVLPPGLARRLDPICEQFLALWKAGQRPRLEDFLLQADPLDRAVLVRELLACEVAFRVRQGEQPVAAEYHARLAEHAGAVDAAFAEALSTHGPTAPAGAGAAGLPLERAGRYVIEEQLARGGMGVVWRARDPELGRTLAVKVLRGELRQRPAAERRFRDEARITAQLQHPGVPPVHELGTLADGRPFLAMKLIDGRTLADLLKERATPHDDLPRLLSIFEQVCQTLAYAHSRRIIHRDLKPLNIMVGAFGEVQVMDWGLAKTLDCLPADTTEDGLGEPAGDETGLTQPGSAIGTPTFMAPEQARGEHDTLDERCDVFGLGALLCVILTGCPPFQGISRNSIVARARQGDLADAFARLDASGADPELVRLARHCLAPARQDRPRDAGAVAQAVAAYHAGVQERLHRAERERVLAAARAVEARKRRRLHLALFGAIGLLIAGATLAVVQYRLEQARADSLRVLRDDFNGALERFDASAEQRDALYARIATLRRLDGDTAVLAADALRQRVKETLLARLHGSPALTQINEFFDGVAWLRQHGWHEDASTLEARFRDQRGLPVVRSWPDAEPGSEPLLPADALAATAPRFVALRPTCPDEAELDAVFPAGAWGAAPRAALALNTNDAHAGPLLHAAIAADGQGVLTAGEDGSATLWDLKTNRVLHTWRPDRSAIAGVGFVEPDHVIAVSRAGQVQQWHRQTGQPAGEVMAPVRGLVRCAAGLRDCGQCLVADADGQVVRLAPAAFLCRHPAPVERIVVAPDGRAFLAMSATLSALWSMAPAEAPRWQFDGAVQSAAFNADGSTLALGLADGSIQLLDAATGVLQRTLAAARRGDPALSLAFAPDGQTLAAGTRGGWLKLLPRHGGEVTRWHVDATSVLALAWTAPSRLLAVSRSGRMSWLDRASGQLTPGPRPQGYVLELRPASRWQPRWLLPAGPLGLPLAQAAAACVAAEPASLREAALTGQLRLALWRDQLLLREAAVEARPGDDLRLRLTRHGGTLTCQVNAGPAIVFHDPAPIHGADPGAFAVLLGPHLTPKRLSATWQTLPERPRARNLADQAFYRQQYADALSYLRRAEREEPTPADRRELRYKEALCLLGLHRRDEAEPILREVAGDRQGPWAVLATVQLGELYRTADLAKARRAFAGLLQTGPDVRTQEILPASLRDRIIGLYTPLTTAPNFIRLDPDRVQDLQDLEALGRLFGDDRTRRAEVRRTLVTALFRDGLLSKGLALAEQLRDDPALPPAERRTLIEEMVWMFTLSNRAGEAELLLRALAESADPRDRIYAQLETARMLLRAGKPAEADRLLEPLEEVLAAGADHEERHWLLEAYLLHGFAHDALGDPASAQSAWTAGYETWRRTPSFQHLYGSILASLTNRLTDDEGWRMTQGVLEDLSAGGDRTITPILQNPLARTLLRPMVTRVLRDLWQGPRGTTLARQVALHELAYVDEHMTQVKLATALLIEQFCCIGLPREAVADFDADFWGFVEQLNAGYQAGRLNDAAIENMVRGLYTGKGLETFADAQAEHLSRLFRARLLLIAGHRSRAAGQAADAVRLFQRAGDLAGAGSPLAAVAQRAARALKDGG